MMWNKCTLSYIDQQCTMKWNSYERLLSFKNDRFVFETKQAWKSFSDYDGAKKAYKIIAYIESHKYL